MSTVPLSMTVNGESCTVDVLPIKRLLDVLRDDLHLAGTKEGCGEGECGACSVILNGVLVNSCLVPAVHASGATIRTIEGVASAAGLHPVQQAFATVGGSQCGICTPGMVMASVYLLEHNRSPTREQISAALAGNLCRCTGYQKIIDAVHQASLQPDPQPQ